MTKPPLDEAQMRELAVRMFRVSPRARRELARFIDGKATAADSLAAFRACVRELIFADDQSIISKPLRAELNAWAVVHGTGRVPRTGGREYTTKNVPTRYTTLEVDRAEKAARLAGMNLSTYIRQAVNMAVERDLGPVENADTDAA